MTPREIHDLRDFRLGHLVRENADHRQPFFVHGQHDVERLCVGQAKEPFQHMHHEFHRRVIIVQQHDLVQRRTLRLGLGLGQNRCVIARTTAGVFRRIRHGQRMCRQEIVPLAQRQMPVQNWQYSGFCRGEKGQALPVDQIRAKLWHMSQRAITTVAFDADDTLWQNEAFFRLTQAHFTRLLSGFTDPDHLHDRLLAAERRNLGHYGFGVKGFTLSMIETAIEVTDGQVPAAVIGGILEAGRDMLAHPIELLPHARTVVQAMARDFRVLLITKGDLLDQERKLAQSGLGDLFDGVEIVSDKTAATYAAIFARHGEGADKAVMAGNSLKSDVLPMIAAGGHGVHVPHAMTWALEVADPPQGDARFHAIADLGHLPDLVMTLANPYQI
jgi:putative hydrolase of the HAD superfamily